MTQTQPPQQVLMNGDKNTAQKNAPREIRISIEEMKKSVAEYDAIQAAKARDQNGRIEALLIGVNQKLAELCYFQLCATTGVKPTEDGARNAMGLPPKKSEPREPEQEPEPKLVVA